MNEFNWRNRFEFLEPLNCVQEFMEDVAKHNITSIDEVFCRQFKTTALLLFSQGNSI